MIRVLIERYIDPVQSDALRECLAHARQEALLQPGYISGESLVDAEDLNHWLVISTWRSLSDWEAWQSSEIRMAIAHALRPMLASDESIKVYQMLERL